MKILLTGSNGQLGTSLIGHPHRNLSHEWLFTDVDDLNITNLNEVSAYFSKHQPELVINCAAYTAVDQAEEQKELAFLINETGPANLADACHHHGARLIHISTDYVFSGHATEAYKEDDITGTDSAYGLSKLAGENMIKGRENVIIIRTSWLYSEYGHNFVKTMLRLGQDRDQVSVVNDQYGSPTYAGDLAEGIFRMIESEKLSYPHSEIFHFANSGSCTWFELASAVMELADLNCRVKAISSDEYEFATPRPMYSVLDISKFREVVWDAVPGWKDSLERCVSNICDGVME